MTKKEKVLNPGLGMEVFHETIYNGKELMKIVGIRETEVELEGDLSGGEFNLYNKIWLPIEGLFRLRKVCVEHENGNTCQLPNIHCGYPNCEPYITK